MFWGKKNRPVLYNIVTWGLIFGSVIVFFIYCLTIKTPNLSFYNGQVYEWLEEGTISYGDVRQNINKLPYFTEGESGDILTYTTILKKQDEDIDTLLLRGVHQKIRVYLDGSLVYSFGEEEHLSLGKTPGCAWLMVKLPEQYNGMELKVELETIYKHYGSTIDKLYLGTKTSLIFMVLLQGLFGLILEIPILIIGFGLIIIGHMCRDNKLAARRIIYLGLFALLNSGGLMLQERVGQFCFKRPLINLFLFYIIYSLLPIVLLRFYMTYRSFARSKYIKVIYWVAVLNFFFMHFMQLTSTLDYMETKVINHIIVLLIAVGSLCIYIKEKLAKEAPRLDIFAASFVYAVFGILDILRYYLCSSKGNVMFFSKFGFVFFILILGFSAIKQISGEHASAIEEKTYKKLAYTDLMTDLPNRSAFEKQMEVYRGSGIKPIIAIVDINNLKYINDTYGHKAGDDAIRLVGKNLIDILGDQVTVYRIGGDEFCALSHTLTEDVFNEKFKTVQLSLQKLAMKVPYPLIAACGYVKTGGEGIDKAFIEADYNMYQEKLRLKGIQDESTS